MFLTGISFSIATLSILRRCVLCDGCIGSLAGSSGIFSCLLLCTLILPIHRHGLAREDVGKCTFMRELAVPLYIPLADALWLTRFRGSVRERTRCASGAGSRLVEAARNVAQILS